MTARPLILLVLLVACTDVAPPDRPEPYPFFIELDDGFRAIFSWPRASLPVRVWTEPNDDLVQAVVHAIRVWQDAALYGEFSAVIISDSSGADVIVRQGVAVELARDTTAFRPDCRAGTTIAATEADSAIVLPFRMLVQRRRGADDGGVSACFLTAVAHELGHTLGILGESDDEADLMHVPPKVSVPSRRDEVTFAMLYHTPATIRLPSGR